ncbi:MAG: hypothetical protein DDT39_00914 [Firmicutes bacterium]|nr:hypothetical protein [candidate division NPL-UPA2 bacterium]
MNWWLLWATAILVRKTVSPWVLCGAAALGAAFAFTWLFLPLTLARELILKGVVAAVMVVWCFRPTTVAAVIRQTIALMALSAFSAGITYAIALSTTNGARSPYPYVTWYLVAVSPLLVSLPLRSMWSSLSAGLRAIAATGFVATILSWEG